MSITRPRLGLSFEVAPPAATHPLRTDIACFVGTVARRRVAVLDTVQPMPVVLVRWLQSHRIERVGGVPVAQLRVALDSQGHFAQSLLAQASTVLEKDGKSERDRLDAFIAERTAGSKEKPRFNALLKACRELTPLPESVVEDLRQREFQPHGLLGADELSAWQRIQRLCNLPVPIESFESFDALFAWDQRGIRDRLVREDDPVVATPLGVALRAFFGEGGRRAYVVRTGDPSDVFDTAVGRFAACFPEGGGVSGATVFDDDEDRVPQMPGVKRNVRLGVVVGLSGSGQALALSAAHWVGLEHVYGLPDVSFAVMPDWIDACAQPVPTDIAPADVATSPERFVDCVEEAPPESLPVGRRLPAPRLTSRGLEVWRQLQLRALALLDNPGRAFHRRDVQLIASLPLVGEGRDLPAASQWLSWMAQTDGWLADASGAKGALLSDRLQLAYPWLRTADSADAPGGVEAPEGSLAGVLARSALERGA